MLSLSLTGADADGPARLVTALGVLDRRTAHLLVEPVDVAATQRPSSLPLDLAWIVRLTVPAVAALLQARKTVVRAGGAPTLRDPNPCVRYALAATGTDRRLRVTGAGGGGLPAQARPT